MFELLLYTSVFERYVASLCLKQPNVLVAQLGRLLNGAVHGLSLEQTNSHGWSQSRGRGYRHGLVYPDFCPALMGFNELAAIQATDTVENVQGIAVG